MTQSGMIARQPILLANGQLYAYELLYRNSNQNFATVLDDNQATSSVLVNALTTFGLSKLIDDKMAFINVGRDLLMDSILEIIPKERFVLEILEDVVVDESITERVKYLRELGYTIAIDDLNFEPQMLENFKPLLKMVQVLKFDIAQTGLGQLKEQLDFFRQYNLKFLAEKVETHEEFQACKALGFEYFQGYFFSKPDILKKEKLDPSQTIILGLVTMLNNEETPIKEIELQFSKSIDLTINLLKYLNSAYIGTKSQINSISHAITLLGRTGLARWLTLFLYSDNKNNIFIAPLLESSLFRAKFMSELALRLKHDKKFQEKAYLTGMISLVDGLLNSTFDEIFDEINFEDDIKSAISNKSGSLGKLLVISDIAQKGDERIFAIFAKLGIPQSELEHILTTCFEWVEQNSAPK